MKKLVYICSKCNKKYEAHIHGDVYEVKMFYCSDDGAPMIPSITTTEIEEDAISKAQGT